MLLPWDHADFGQNSLRLAPFDSQMKHPPKNHQFAIDGADFHAKVLPLGCKSRNGLGFNFVQGFVGKLRECHQVLYAIEVVLTRLELRRERRFDVRLKTVLGELAQRHCGLLLSNADFAFENLSTPRGFHLASHSHVSSISRSPPLSAGDLLQRIADTRA